MEAIRQRFISRGWRCLRTAGFVLANASTEKSSESGVALIREEEEPGRTNKRPSLSDLQPVLEKPAAPAQAEWGDDSNGLKIPKTDDMEPIKYQ